MFDKKRYQVLSVILVLSLILGVFVVGCRTQDGDVSQKEKEDEEMNDDEKQEDEKEDESDGFEFVGYPMDAEDVTLSWWVGGGFTLHDAYITADESPFHSELIEHTGVNIDWQFRAEGQNAAESISFMLASGDLPDIMYSLEGKGIDRYMEEEVVRDLTDHIAEHSPAYYKFLKSKEIYDKSFKTDDSRYYGYGHFREDGGWNDTYQGPVIRQDWLDKANLKTPETLSDWEETIRTFNNEYDAVLSFGWNRFRTTGISGAFGAYGAADYQLFVDDNNKIQLAQAQPEWKDYMAKLNEWWESGLLDKEVMDMNDDIARTKAANEIMGISFTSMGQLTNWRGDAEAEGTDAEWVGLQYPRGDDGTLPMVFGGYGFRTDVAVITTQCPDEHLEIAMRLLDYPYTEEGNLYWNFGTQGVSWDYDDSGEPEFTDLVANDPLGLNDAIPKYSGTVWNSPAIQATKLLYLKNSEESIAANDTWFYPNEDVTASWKMPPGVTLTQEESNKLADLGGTISSYVADMAVKFIRGEESLDNFDNFLEQLDRMKLPELLDIHQGAYDRYLAR